MNRTYTCHNDPGHGWCEVPVSDLQLLGIDKAISGYSYIKGDIAYLEEDCDFSTLMYAAEAAGWTIKLVHVEEDPTPIRNYRRYPENPNWKDNLAKVPGCPIW